MRRSVHELYPPRLKIRWAPDRELHFLIYTKQSRVEQERGSRASKLNSTQLDSGFLDTSLDRYIMGGVLEVLLSLSLLQAVSLILAILTVVCFLSVYFSAIRYPTNLPRYGEEVGATSFSWRTRKAYYVDCKNMFKDAYEKVLLQSSPL